MVERNLPNDLFPALLTILGSIGAALAVSKRERAIRLENEKLKVQLLLWRLLAVGAAVTSGVSWFL